MIKLITTLLVLIVGVGATFYFVRSKPKPLTPPENITTAPTKIPTTAPKNDDGVPLPTGEDIIRVFITLINDKRIDEAVNMMNKISISDESRKQEWGVMFNSFNSLVLKSVAAYDQENWTPDWQEYKVVLVADVKPNSGLMWDNGESVYWMTLTKEGQTWKTSGFATGP